MSAPSSEPRVYSAEVVDALKVLPEYAEVLGSRSADFDDIVECMYGADPVSVPGAAPQIPTPAEAAKQQAYRRLLAVLRSDLAERETMEEIYTCTRIKSAAALSRPVLSAWYKRPYRWPCSGDTWNIHYTLNAVPEDRDIVQQFERCSDLAIRADRLPGDERETATRLIFEAHSKALAALDLRRDSPDQVLVPADLASLQARVDAVAQYYADSARAQANTLYFLGTLYGAAFLLGLYDVISWRTGGDPVGPLTPLVLSAGGGALGAMVSVMQRMGSPEGVVVNFAVPKSTLLIWGGLRPAIGAIVGTIIQVLVLGHLLPLVTQEPAVAPYSYLGLGFLAGFSERWAKDILAKAPAGFAVSDDPPLKPTSPSTAPLPNTPGGAPAASLPPPSPTSVK